LLVADGPHVRFWHLADIETDAQHVRSSNSSAGAFNRTALGPVLESGSMRHETRFSALVH